MTASAALFRVATFGTSDFDDVRARLARRGQTDLERVEPTVRQIVASIRADGDRALRQWIEQTERRQVQQLLRRDYDGAAALAGLGPELGAALTEAARRIRSFHEHQAASLGGFEITDGEVTLGTRVRPLGRVGVYAPGGKARYPSSVLMCAVVAQVAGVGQIVVATPNPSPEVRAACHLAGVEAILDAGGAQAIAALAYGTESVPRVDKIVGPGNIYVAAAKRLVFGEVDIDAIAGPSEILVLADESADPELVAADLLSQAEHDEAAYALLCTTHAPLVDAVGRALEAQLARLPRHAIAEASLRANGHALIVSSTDDLVALANELAAEHVAVQMRAPRSVAERVLAAGAIFVGPMTPEAAGDYVAGPSHVLPTGGAARYGSPLGVYDFVARTSMIEYSGSALARTGATIETLARAEGLEGHAQAVVLRTRVKSGA